MGSVERYTPAVSGSTEYFPLESGDDDSTAVVHRNASRRIADAVALVPELERRHSGWMAGKLEPLLPYLNRNAYTEKKRAAVQQDLRVHYYSGLELSVGKLTQDTDDTFSTETAVLSYSTRFFNMLRACEQFDVPPNQALELAKRSYNRSGQQFAELVTKNQDVSSGAVARATLSEDPTKFLEEYRRIKELDPVVSEYERTHSLLGSTVRNVMGMIRLRYEQDISASEVVEYLDRLQESDSANTKRPDQRGVQINGVPILAQKHYNWCGYTDLSMVLQYHGYTQLTPEALFAHYEGEYDRVLETMAPRTGAPPEGLALIAEELTTLHPKLTGMKELLFLQKKYPHIQSEEFPETLLQSYIRRGDPVMVRTPLHWVIAKGFDDTGYNIINPSIGRELRMTKGDFLRQWAKDDDKIPDAEYLMLVISKGKN